MTEFTVGVARFATETTTFAPGRTGIDDFEHEGPPLTGDDVLDSSPYTQGFAARTAEVADTELVGVSSPRWPRGGSSGSWVTEEAFEKYSTCIAEGMADIDGLDGVYLSLHGAMAVEGVDSPEAETVRRVRAAIDDQPIYVTLDLHANVDAALAAAADAVLAVKRYPHYDSHLQGERAARLLHKQLRDDFEPAIATREPGVITPSVFQGTGESPAMEIMERARRLEAAVPGAYISVCFGFAYADVPTAGATVYAMTDGNPELAERMAEGVSEYVWEQREPFANKSLPKTEEGVRQAIDAAEAGDTPVVLADHADRIGDSTHVLRELIEQGASEFVVATINDEAAIERIAENADQGERVTVSVGGHAERLAGEPVELDAEVEYLGSYDTERSHYDRIAVLRFGADNRVILTPELHQVTSPDILDDLEIPYENAIVAIKSRVHFRRGFVEPGVAGEVVVVDAPGIGPADLTELAYENVPSDLYPLNVR